MTDSVAASSDIKKQPHHDRDELCTVRPSYRQGRKLTAVKVYTVNDESQHLIIRGVPALNLQREVKHLCLRYGDVKVVHAVANYADDEEAFTEVYHAHFARIQSARFAKHMMDDKAFFGGVLHVCYAPELESLSETRHKLTQRTWDVMKRIRKPTASLKQVAQVSKGDSCSYVSPQEVSSFTPVDVGVKEQIFVPRTSKNSILDKTKTNSRVTEQRNSTNNSPTSSILKRNYKTQFLPSSLKKLKVEK